ncbi:MAG: recombinase family protein [Oscillospiraceae bacterium]
MSRVTKIPATISRYTAAPIDTPVRRRVAAYARVSTDHEEQLTSYEAQVSYYTDYIKQHSEWEFIKVYADEGISGCSTAKREGFKQMVADALAGRFDLIITKSVSRFARNTVDSLTTIRKLKEHNVECYFEKESIWTFDGRGELLISIMSSLAQEESRSISENVIWGQRKRMADGKPNVPFSRFLGYDRGADGKMIVNKEEARIVREIYRLFLSGLTPHTIAKKLTEQGIRTPAGKEKWHSSTIKSILTNEKYKGDALLQKTYTSDFLTKKKKINHGEIPMYYVEGSHEGIVTPEIFEAVQAEMEKRQLQKSRYSGVDILASKLICGECGCFYSPKVWHSTDRYRRIIYQCGHKYKNQNRCTTPHLTAEKIKSFFIQSVNAMLKNRDEVISNLREGIKMVSDCTALEQERDRMKEETVLLAEMVESIIMENARVALDQTEYRKKYDSLSERYETAKSRYEALERQIEEMHQRVQMMENFINSISKMNPLTEFDETLWGTLLESITIYSTEDIRIKFRDGMC